MEISFFWPFLQHCAFPYFALTLRMEMSLLREGAGFRLSFFQPAISPALPFSCVFFLIPLNGSAFLADPATLPLMCRVFYRRALLPQ